MKNVIILFMLLISTTVFSQEDKNRIEKIRKSGKSAYYLTNETLKSNKFMKSHNKFLKTMRNKFDDKSEPIETFKHPERCIYLLGAEDNGLTKEAIDKCHKIV